jgi:hypothetical protein
MNLEITNPLRARGIGGSKGREGGRGGGRGGEGRDECFNPKSRRRAEPSLRETS